MKTKYDKFLLSHAVAKRAKEMVEDGACYLTKEERVNRPIHDAIKEIMTDKVKIELSIDKNIDLKEDEDTLEQLYEDVKVPKDQLAKQAEVEEEDEEPSDEELAAAEAEMKDISKDKVELSEEESKAIDKEKATTTKTKTAKAKTAKAKTTEAKTTEAKTTEAKTKD